MMEELTGTNYLIAKSAVKQVYNYYGTTDADDEEDMYDEYVSSYLDTPKTNSYSYYDDHYPSRYSEYDDIASGVGAVLAILGSLFIFILILGIASIVALIAKWSVFKKANVDGWEALIPVHNEVVELKLAGIKTYWYFLNLLVFPLAVGPIILSFWRSIKLAHSFGKGTGFGIGLALLPVVFYPILAWGSAQYIGPQTQKRETNENIFYTENNNNQPQPTPTVVNNPTSNAEPTIVTPSVDESSYTDPTAETKKEEKEEEIKEENPVKSKEETKSDEE